MSYRVRITDSALKAIKEQARYIAVEHKAPDAAKRWLERVFDAADTLAQTPRRCARAVEDAYHSSEIRWLGIGEFMLLFTVKEKTKTVWVVGGRSARQLPQPQDLPEEPGE